MPSGAPRGHLGAWAVRERTVTTTVSSGTWGLAFGIRGHSRGGLRPPTCTPASMVEKPPLVPGRRVCERLWREEMPPLVVERVSDVTADRSPRGRGGGPPTPSRRPPGGSVRLCLSPPRALLRDPLADPQLLLGQEPHKLGPAQPWEGQWQRLDGGKRTRPGCWPPGARRSSCLAAAPPWLAEPTALTPPLLMKATFLGGSFWREGGHVLPALSKGLGARPRPQGTPRPAA